MKTKDDFFNDAKSVTIVADDPIHRSYSAFLNFPKTKATLTEDDVLCIAHIVYGWMPTMLDFDIRDGRLAKATKILNKAKKGKDLSNEDFKCLIETINNSLVGVSKLLHFVAPQTYAIWDSRVYSYLRNDYPYSYRTNNLDYYNCYLKFISEIQKDRRFNECQKELAEKIGYKICPTRAVEFAMFSHGRKSTW